MKARYPAKDLRPHFAPTAAGFMSGMSETDNGADLRAVRDCVPDYDFTINAIGDSMMPLIHDGDLLFCRDDDGLLLHLVLRTFADTNGFKRAIL